MIGKAAHYRPAHRGYPEAEAEPRESLSTLALTILDTIHAKGRGITATEIAQAEYELQLRGLIAYGCCSNRYLSHEGKALAELRVWAGAAHAAR